MKDKAKCKVALFPGTFDPPSLGHLDIIKRSAQICDKLYIGIAENISKPTGLFSLNQKKAMLEKITQGMEQVKIISFSGLVIDWARENNVDFLIRGLRAFSDFEYEFQMALANRKMSGIETIFLMSDANYSHISSSLIREIASFKHTLKDFVPKDIEKSIYDTLQY